MRLTEKVHQYLKPKLQSGATAIDATAGNGHDTLFLAQCVGETGEVFAFDVQAQALASAKQHLQAHAIQTSITWIHAGHEDMLKHIPIDKQKHIQVITFNLGYLPHGDRHITTQPKHTLMALNASLSLLAQGGIVSILAYTGHAGGREECEAIKAWASALSDDFILSIHIPEHTRTSPPEWICIQKKLA